MTLRYDLPETRRSGLLQEVQKPAFPTAVQEQNRKLPLRPFPSLKAWGYLCFGGGRWHSAMTRLDLWRNRAIAFRARSMQPFLGGSLPLCDGREPSRVYSFIPRLTSITPTKEKRSRQVYGRY